MTQAWLTQTPLPEDADRLQETIWSLATRIEEKPVELLELTGLDLELSGAPILDPGTREIAGWERTSCRSPAFTPDEGIVELHGGRVMVESQGGKGDVFTIWLPLARQIR